jgi:signal transduction histidine kinase
MLAVDGGIMAARSRVKRSLKTRVKRGAKAPARTSRAGKKTAPKKAGPGQIAAKKPARKLPAKRPAKRPETESGIVEAALAAFAHEVRTPLTGILAISSLLATSELGEREKRWVDTIKVGAEHLAALATLFVDAARSGSTGLSVRQDFFDLRTLSRTLGDSLAGRASAKGLQSQVTIAEGLPAFVIGDPVRLRAALENLIDNAVKFTQQGDVALDVSV